VAIGRILKIHSHDTNIIDHRRTNGRDEQENRGREQEKRPNVVEEAGFRHLELLCDVVVDAIRMYCLLLQVDAQTEGARYRYFNSRPRDI
jgi:hypothetical protein